TAVTVQEDGKILVSGYFSMVGNTSRQSLARLNPDGTLDTAFALLIDSAPSFMLPELGGNVLLAGNFNVLGTVSRSGLARIHGDVSGIHPIEFTDSQYAADEASGAAVISVRRRGTSDTTVNVGFVTSDGSGSAGVDYVATAGTLTFLPLETVKSFTVPLLI